MVRFTANGHFFRALQKTIDALFAGPAVCSPQLRQSVEAHAARLGGAHREPVETPADLTPYLTKIALHAYRITDADIEHLKACGYSEDAIFEITLCAAMGAGLARLERGMTALKGAGNAPACS